MTSKKSNYFKPLKPFAQELRSDSTMGEIILWKRALKSKQIFDYQFNRQFPLEIDHLKIIVDFICRKLKLIIEIDGNSHNFKQKQDAIRDQSLKRHGYHILRFREMEVRKRLDYVVAIIDDKIKELESQSP